MNYRKFSLFILLSFMFMPSARASLNIENETLTYQAKFMWVLPGGHTTITLEPDTQERYKISATYDSPRWFSSFF